MTKERQISLWLFTCCFMVFAMAIIGAITRLTESGLSIVEWKPLLGTLPPLNEQAWQHVYDMYRQSPEFEKKHFWMELGDFKKIYFWEWFHRLWGRMIGLAFALPLLWFWVKNMIPQGYKLKLLGLFALGGAQGLLGWYMVQSGLIDRPSVSHFRLAAHLALALLVFSLMLWCALNLWSQDATLSSQQKSKPATAAQTKTQSTQAPPLSLKIHFLAALTALSLTIIWGAFVAGLDAGMIYNSFPQMAPGQLTPDETFAAAALLHNHGWVQFTHRALAIITGLIILTLSWRTKFWLLGIAVLLQIGLGIATLLTQIWLPLATLHQAGAILVLGLLLYNLQRSCRKTI